MTLVFSQSLFLDLFYDFAYLNPARQSCTGFYTRAELMVPLQGDQKSLLFYI